MELILIRHAIAFERAPKRWPDDAERPLSPRGQARARQAAAGLRRLVERPAHLLSSPLLRARQTAAILTRCANWPSATDCPQLAPGTPPEEFLALLASSKAPRSAAVGHEPDLSALLAICLYGSPAAGRFEFKKMGVARLSFEGAVRAGGGRLLWFLPPKLLRTAR